MFPTDVSEPVVPVPVVPASSMVVTAVTGDTSGVGALCGGDGDSFDLKEAMAELAAEAGPAMKVMAQLGCDCYDNDGEGISEQLEHCLPFVRFCVRTFGTKDVNLASDCLSVLANSSYAGVDVGLPQRHFLKDVLRVIKAHWEERSVVLFGLLYMLNCLVLRKDENMATVQALIGPSALESDNRTIIARALAKHRFPSGKDDMVKSCEDLQYELGFPEDLGVS